MKKIYLICPADTQQMPYIQVYLSVLTKLNLAYELIVWDRKGNISGPIEGYVYKDGKKNLRRGLLDYYKFSKFYKNIINRTSGSIVVAFGLPILFFMSRGFILRNNVIADIRDFHILLNFNPFFKEKLKETSLNVVSSPAFKSWLPKNTSFVVNHNTNSNPSSIRRMLKFPNTINQKISCIGALKDIDVIRELLSVGNELSIDNIEFMFHGEGIINDELKKISRELRNLKIKITGRYQKENEDNLYLDADWINMFMSPNSINNKTCLSNRLYNSVINGIPLLCYNGSYIADIINKYYLGLTFENVNDFYLNFSDRASHFDFQKYEAGRVRFFIDVDSENQFFIQRLQMILTEG